MLKYRRHPLSDQEFVERIRRHTPANRKAATALSGLYGTILLALLYFIPRYVKALGHLAPDATAYDHGFALGVFVGATAAVATIFLIWHLIHSLTIAFGSEWDRPLRLLVKYYDLALRDRAPASSKDASPPPAAL
jgi:hypothetical protein